MLKNSWGLQRFRIRHLFDRIILLDLALFALLLCGVYILGQSVGGHPSATVLTAILTTLNTILGTAVIYLWLKFLWRRLPVWLAIGGAVLTLWGLTAPTLSLPVSFIAGPEVGPQLLVTLFGVGLLGSVIALTEITRQAQTGQGDSYWAILARSEVLPSFTGFGALIINSILRVCRDRFFIAVLAVFVLTILAKNASVFDAGSYLALITVGSITLTVIIAYTLAPLSLSLTTKFPGLPTQHQMIDFAATIAGLLILFVISWTVSFGLLRLDVATCALLTAIALIGQVITFFVATSVREVDSLGVFGAWWIIIIETVVLLVSYQILAELNLLGNLLVLLVAITTLFSTTFYQASRR